MCHLCEPSYQSRSLQCQSELICVPLARVAGWGPEFLMLYNDLHAQSIGDQHPSSFGKPAAEAWGETWSEYKAMAESVMNDGAALAREDDLIFLNEVETYQSWRWTPLTRGDGTTGPSLTFEARPPWPADARWNTADHCLPRPLVLCRPEVGGVMINSLDVTRKILKQRWLMIIRDLSTRLCALAPPPSLSRVSCPS
jgi:hypothetical protein